LFGFLKEKLKKGDLSMAEQINKVITAIWDSVTCDELQNVFAEWIQRLTWVIAERSEYYSQ
jgi:hypothetical protein